MRRQVSVTSDWSGNESHCSQASSLGFLRDTVQTVKLLLLCSDLVSGNNTPNLEEYQGPPDMQTKARDTQAAKQQCQENLLRWSISHL